MEDEIVWPESWNHKRRYHVQEHESYDHVYSRM